MPERMFLGIDPGKKGAIALFNPSSHHLTIADMPLLPKKNGKGEDTNYAALGELLRPTCASLIHCMMEDVWSMPREGVSSAHAFGRNNGALLMALAIYQIPHQLVTAAKWKKYFNLSQDKGISRRLASERFPHDAEQFSRVKDDGRAEAALLALYAAETFKLT
jgi:crossover junction endodeoxyribonuclease RuvC